MEWYPKDKKELNNLLEKFLKIKNKNGIAKVIHGLIVPHAGYSYSGEIAGEAYRLLKSSNQKKAMIIAPSHYIPLRGILSPKQSVWKTPMGEIKIIDYGFKKADISQEHAISNQIPFLQKLGFNEIIPIIIGEINSQEARIIAKQISDFKGIFIISSDLSHFLPSKQAVKKDKETIKAILNLDSEKLLSIENSACGIFPLLIIIELCKIKGWKPKLITYKNSGDITHDEKRVVGYASFNL